MATYNIYLNAEQDALVTKFMQMKGYEPKDRVFAVRDLALESLKRNVGQKGEKT